MAKSSSNDDLTSLTTTMVLAVGVAALASSQLDLGFFYASFLDLADAERLAFVGLVFATLTILTTAVQWTSLSKPASPKKRSYPLAEIEAATTDKEKFMVLFPYLKQQILDEVRDENELLEEAVKHLDRMMEYSVPGGKLNRGTTVIAVFRSLSGGKLSTYATAQAAVLGWCIEFLQAFFLVADDVMDESETRRGAPCWYKLPDIGIVAVNDSFLLESFVYTILKLHFDDHENYAELLQLLLDVTQKTEIGQLYDLTSQPLNGKIDLDRFTMTRYAKIVKYKTAFYSFYLPVAMGMRLAGVQEESAYTLARTICVEMGEYFQIQDDYLDCFGDPDVIGKVGTDIQDNKCSWLVVQALQKCNSKQVALLKANYGQWNDSKVAKIKKLYKELELSKLYETYEESFYKSIQAKLNKVTDMPKEVFEIFLNKIYKRSK